MTTSPSGSAAASRPLRPTVASTRAVPTWTSTRAPSRGSVSGRVDPAAPSDVAGRRATRIRSVAMTARIRRQNGAPGDRRRLDAGEVDRGPAALGAGDVAAVDLEARGRGRRSAPGTSRNRVSRSIGPPRRLPVTTVPRPRTLNERSTASRGPRAADADAARSRASTASRTPTSAARTSSSPAPVTPDATTTAAPRSEVRARSVPDRRDDLDRAIGVHRIGLRHHREPDVDAERVEQLEMLERLSPRPVVGRHDEHRRVDLARPDEHVADQPIVAGHVDEVDLGPVVEREMGVPDVDRHPPPPLLGQPVRVDPGQRPEQRRLAVVDVTGSPDDDGHGRSASRIARVRSASRPGSTVRRSTTARPCSIRPMTGGSPTRSRSTIR